LLLTVQSVASSSSQLQIPEREFKLLTSGLNLLSLRSTNT